VTKKRLGREKNPLLTQLGSDRSATGGLTGRKYPRIEKRRSSVQQGIQARAPNKRGLCVKRALYEGREKSLAIGREEALGSMLSGGTQGLEMR